jgi:hypothetical protein
MAERAHLAHFMLQGTPSERHLWEGCCFCLPFVQGKQVLDVPCGAGGGPGAASLTGVDADPEAIRYNSEIHTTFYEFTGTSPLGLPGQQFEPMSVETFEVPRAVKFDMPRTRQRTL